MQTTLLDTSDWKTDPTLLFKGNPGCSTPCQHRPAPPPKPSTASQVATHEVGMGPQGQKGPAHSPPPSPAGDVYPGDPYANDEIGIHFRFPALATARGEVPPAPQWALAHEAHAPFFILRFVPTTGLGCQVVITKEPLPRTQSLAQYVLLSKQQTERTLAAYSLVFQSERQLLVGGHAAYEIVYTQGGSGDTGDMLVWSLCVHAFDKVITLQVGPFLSGLVCVSARARARHCALDLLTPCVCVCVCVRACVRACVYVCVSHCRIYQRTKRRLGLACSS